MGPKLTLTAVILVFAAVAIAEFLFVLRAPRFKGAVQSVVHPIAIR